MRNATTSKSRLKINARPIGVFDSGVGGLTVVKALRKILPNEDIIYFGDTARVPYGTKSTPVITQFAFQDTKFLINRKVKLIVVACHTVSSVCLPELKKSFKIPIIGVIEPGAKAVVKATRNKRVGIIGTQATILAGAYERAIKALDPQIEIIAKPTPLFVPLVEEGWLSSPITLQVAKTYLSVMIDEDIDTILLGCTHYPLLKNVLRKLFAKKIKIIDASLETAIETKNTLAHLGLLTDNKNKGILKVYLSDLSSNFLEIGERFLNINLGNVFRASLSE
ncbi:MAG: glutamate racemase [candidate division WOR-3 bacterium]|nr:glutamate racemase [candidate division WOR-3 bacterium]